MSLVERGPRGWVFFSGLPQLLGAEGTAVLRALVDLEGIGAGDDSAVKASLKDLMELTGMDVEGVTAGIRRLRDLKCVSAWVPDNSEEECLFRLKAPLPCPRTWNWVRDHGRFGPKLARAAERGAATNPTRVYRDEEPEPDAVELNDVYDAYFSHVSMKADAMLTDRVNGLVRAFGAWRVRKVFLRCGELNRKDPTSIPRGLRWCEAELRRWTDMERKKREREELPQRHPPSSQATAGKQASFPSVGGAGQGREGAVVGDLFDGGEV
jgi:hypothetical protein